MILEISGSRKDVELALYLAYEDPSEPRRVAVRERQTMACISRMHAGERAGDLHAMEWPFDLPEFTRALVPRGIGSLSC